MPLSVGLTDGHTAGVRLLAAAAAAVFALVLIGSVGSSPSGKSAATSRDTHSTTSTRPHQMPGSQFMPFGRVAGRVVVTGGAGTSSGRPAKGFRILVRSVLTGQLVETSPVYAHGVFNLRLQPGTYLMSTRFPASEGGSGICFAPVTVHAALGVTSSAHVHCYT